MDTPFEAAPDVFVLPSGVDIPGMGVLLTNAFLLRSAEPVLVDTGLGVDGDRFVEALEQVIDPNELRWIWLTHDDADHTGNIQRVMEWAPNATLATHAFGAMRMSTWWPLPLDRVRAITLGDVVDVGDRTLTAVRPPLFDNPMSIGLLDSLTGTLFSVDSFGAILPERTQSATEVPEDVLSSGMVMWGTFDSPWAHLVDRGLYARSLKDVEALAPARILSSHLPPAVGNIERFIEMLAKVPDAEPSAPPSDELFRQMLAHMEAPPV